MNMFTITVHKKYVYLSITGLHKAYVKLTEFQLYVFTYYVNFLTENEQWSISLLGLDLKVQCSNWIVTVAQFKPERKGLAFAWRVKLN